MSINLKKEKYASEWYQINNNNSRRTENGVSIVLCVPCSWFLCPQCLWSDSLCTQFIYSLYNQKKTAWVFFFVVTYAYAFALTHNPHNFLSFFLMRYILVGFFSSSSSLLPDIRTIKKYAFAAHIIENLFFFSICAYVCVQNVYLFSIEGNAFWYFFFFVCAWHF